MSLPLVSPAPRRVQVAAAAGWALVGGLIGMYLVVFALSAFGRLTRPYEEFAYGESWLLDDARRVAAGEPLYAPVDRLPLTHTAYTPVYYVLVGHLQRVLGDTGYSLGRAVSLAGALAAAGCLSCAVRRLTQSWLAAALAAGLFLTQNLTVLLWAPLHRVDALALAFTLCGLALATAGRHGSAAAVFLLAILTKQTFLVGPAAVCLALWPCWREIARFGAILVGALLAAVVVGQALTNGWFLWHTVLANSNQAELQTFSQLMGSFMQFNGLPVLAATASLALPATCRQERIWRWYLLGSVATLPSVAKIGASSNYWLEISAATAALLAVASYRLSRCPQARLVAPVMVAGALLISIPGYQANAREALDSMREVIWPSAPAYLSLVSDVSYAPMRVETGFVRNVAAEPGELLTDNPGLAVAAGKRIAYEFQIFQLLYVEGRWSQAPILSAIAQRRFSLVALMHPLDGPTLGTRWTTSIRDALLATYAPAGQQSGFWLYRPTP
ncbi:MAG: hypothetical protein M3336_13470 [Chloroflexota bacterium]|nr:hypothetical protein [Chloroflexota bacterium]